MPPEPIVAPLPKRKRQITFLLFTLIFVVSLPFLYLYATGNKLDFKNPDNVIGTGGMYIAVERTGAEIYIDGELVKETRIFRRAFYAQNVVPGTHRVHVQKEDHHTWVKELPVAAHLVTEAQAFNLPNVPEVRVISKWRTATGSEVVSTEMPIASTTNTFIATTSPNTVRLSVNPEYVTLLGLFATTTGVASTTTKVVRTISTTTATSSPTVSTPTTTKEQNGVRLFEKDGDVYAKWVGDQEDTPYYYCAKEFPLSSKTILLEGVGVAEITPKIEEEPFMHPMQIIPGDTECDPRIKLDRKNEMVRGFDLYPGSIDLVLMSLESGIYAVEVDNRAWQNVQSFLVGKNLTMRILNGQVYVFDGALIYQVILEEF